MIKARRISALLLAAALLLGCIPQALAVGEQIHSYEPIRTGDPRIDSLADELLKQIPTDGKTDAQKIQAVYDWIIRNCVRDGWDGTTWFDEAQVSAAADALARDPNYQAVMPIRGKILNCLKADYDKIFKSEIITDLIKMLGCGVQVKSKANKSIASFDINALRWSKIILCTDADVDGFQIRTLLLTMLYRLTPQLIEEHKVFIAESPLYEITAKDKTYFAYNEREKDEFLTQLEGQKFTIQRSKGLGENDPDMMNLTTMNPKTRRLIQVKPGDAERTAQMFDILLGDNLTGRKDYIATHGSEYLDDLDIS